MLCTLLAAPSQFSKIIGHNSGLLARTGCYMRENKNFKLADESGPTVLSYAVPRPLRPQSLLGISRDWNLFGNTRFTFFLKHFC